LEASFKNDTRELARLHDFIDQFCSSHALPPPIDLALHLALGEHVTNIIAYAYDDQGEHQIITRLWFREGNVEAEVEDDGRPFNPLQYPAVDATLPLDERPIGGLGIHLLRRSMEELNYSRQRNNNILWMRKRIN
jgi:anti-sigma regulatory factor (Ser/Thr protein kinase)